MIKKCGALYARFYFDIKCNRSHDQSLVMVQLLHYGSEAIWLQRRGLMWLQRRNIWPQYTHILHGPRGAHSNFWFCTFSCFIFLSNICWSAFIWTIWYIFCCCANLGYFLSVKDTSRGVNLRKKNYGFYFIVVLTMSADERKKINLN